MWDEESPPSRRRGLKSWRLERYVYAVRRRLLLGGVDWNHFFVSLDVESLSRLLLGGVDWNSIASLDFSCHLVASFLEAWIEIFCFFFLADGFLSPPSWRRGLKSIYETMCSIQFLSPPSWRRGLKSQTSVSMPSSPCRLLLGGMDWNDTKKVTHKLIVVASFMEAWIEIGFLHSLQIIISSLIVLLLSSCSCVNIKPRRRQVKTAPVLYFLASVLFLR